MEKKPPTFTVLLDANVWIEERMLKSALGSALLYALAGAKATLALPEIVEREVNQVMPDLARRAVQNIRRDMTLLTHLSGREMNASGPTPKAISDGMSARWQQLSGSIERIAFTFEQANAALSRIIAKTPRCGENNEQFRDCCIWEAGLSLADTRTLHLVSADHAFYDGRKYANGLAKGLRAEVERRNVQLSLYPTVQDLLSALRNTVVSIDERAIATSIVDSISSEARAIASEKGSFELGRALAAQIKGYATPKEALVAVSFELHFELDRMGAGAFGEDEKALLTLKGECDFDPNRNAVSAIEVKSWSQRIGHSWGSAHYSSEKRDDEKSDELRVQ